MTESRDPRPRPAVDRGPVIIPEASIDAQELSLDNVRSLDPVARLVDRARRGDKDAYGQVFRLHRDAICRLARLHVGTEFDDVVTEVFVRAWVQLPRYRQSDGPFVAWLYGIAREVFANEQERPSRVEPTAEPADIAMLVDDDRTSLASAIRNLPREQRRVIEMRFLMGMRDAEVAAALRTTPDAVNEKQWRALTTLRGEMVSGA
jgi:RNA polymerase sigma-70 factor (ECF subfamily)